MTSTHLKFRATRTDFIADRIELRLAMREPNGVSLAQPIIFQFYPRRPEDPAPPPAPPILTMNKDDAQQLMDELWHVGLRPTEGHGSAGQHAATLRHLEDMRTLVFKPLTLVTANC